MHQGNLIDEVNISYITEVAVSAPSPVPMGTTENQQPGHDLLRIFGNNKLLSCWNVDTVQALYVFTEEQLTVFPEGYKAIDF
jgi:hypothetical protein